MHSAEIGNIFQLNLQLLSQGHGKHTPSGFWYSLLKNYFITYENHSKIWSTDGNESVQSVLEISQIRDLNDNPETR